MYHPPVPREGRGRRREKETTGGWVGSYTLGVGRYVSRGLGLRWVWNGDVDPGRKGRRSEEGSLSGSLFGREVRWEGEMVGRHVQFSTPHEKESERESGVRVSGFTDL